MPQDERRRRRAQHERRESRRRIWRRLRLPLLGLAVIALAGAGFLGYQWIARSRAEAATPAKRALVRDVRLRAFAKATNDPSGRFVWLDIVYEPKNEKAPNISCSADSGAGSVYRSGRTWTILSPGVVRKSIDLGKRVTDGRYQVRCMSGGTFLEAVVTVVQPVRSGLTATAPATNTATATGTATGSPLPR